MLLANGTEPHFDWIVKVSGSSSRVHRGEGIGIFGNQSETSLIVVDSAFGGVIRVNRAANQGNMVDGANPGALRLLVNANVPIVIEWRRGCCAR